MVPLLMTRLFAEIAGALAALLSIYFLYTEWRGAEAHAALLQAQLTQERANEKIVTQYVDRKVEVIRRVPVIQRELVRMCDSPNMPSAGSAATAPVAQAGNVQAGVSDSDKLAGEIAACLSDDEQLASLIDALHQQTKP